MSSGSIFPTALASYCVVFSMDELWVSKAREEKAKVSKTEPKKPEKETESKAISYALLYAQPLMDKMRSSDMIVRVITIPDKKLCFALVSISEKRQKMVAQVMGPLIRLRVVRKDDEENVVRNGGAWSDFKQHLAQVLRP